MRFKPLTKDDVTFELTIEGDLCAWCCVNVTATWEAADGTKYCASAYLGCCSYEDKKDFKERGGYYEYLYDDVLEQLNVDLQATVDALKERIVR